MEGIIHAHSGIRWIILFLLLVTVVRAFLNRNNSEFGMQAKLGLFTMISMHIQLTIGLALLMSGRVAEVESLKFLYDGAHNYDDHCYCPRYTRPQP